MKKMKEKVKEVTEPRNRLFWTMNKMVEELNPKIQGWRNYYAMDSFADQFLNKIDWYIRKRLMLFWNKKRNRRKKHSNSRLAGIVARAFWIKETCRLGKYRNAEERRTSESRMRENLTSGLMQGELEK